MPVADGDADGEAEADFDFVDFDAEAPLLLLLVLVSEEPSPPVPATGGLAPGEHHQGCQGRDSAGDGAVSASTGGGHEGVSPLYEGYRCLGSVL